MEANPQLASAAFGLGIVALMWVFRRTLLRLARLKRDPDELAYSARRRSAGLEIDDITAREWLHRNRASMQLGRLAEPSPEHLATLAAISAWQSSMQRKG